MPEYVLLACERSGLHLHHGHAAGAFSLREHCGDACVWEWASPSRASLRNASTGCVVAVEKTGTPPPAAGSGEAAALDAQFGPGFSVLVPQKYRLLDGGGKLLGPLDGRLTFAARDAPSRLPSVYLAELEAQGWTCVDNIMSPDHVSHMIAATNAVREKHAEKEAKVKAAQDTRPYKSNDNLIRPGALLAGTDDASLLGMTPAVAQALMHPISLHLIETYLGAESIHYCQCPGFSIMRPAEKTGDLARVEPGGWHSDYPYPLTSETEAHTYMLGPSEFEKLDASIAPLFPDWKTRNARLGMQFNIALTDFTPQVHKQSAVPA